MMPPVLQESSIMPTNTLEEDEVELEQKVKDGKKFIHFFPHVHFWICYVSAKDTNSCERKRHKLAGSIDQPQQEIEIPAIEYENKGLGDHSLEFSAYLIQSNGEANGCSEGHVHGQTSEEPAVWSRLNKLCSTSGWKYPTYNFEEQGPPHAKMFTCKVTVYMDSITDTIVECFGEAKPRKNAA